MKKLVAQILILLLMLDAAYVAFGLLNNWVMWPWICLYWVILTAKNAWDLYCTGGSGDNG